MNDAKQRLESLHTKVRDAVKRLRLIDDENEIKQLERTTLAADFWNDPAGAAATQQRLAALRKDIDKWRSLESSIRDELDLVNDPDMAELAGSEDAVVKLEKEFSAYEVDLKLSGPHDKSSALLEIHAGTGGTDAQDWASMLQRMYLRYAESHDMKAEIISSSPGEEAGLKSATIEISGTYAYGKLKGESGVHRLVRLSPFNSDNLRQTSFALVEVLPRIDRASSLEIEPKDLRIDVYRAGGHGGQSVNTTDSAVRITHLPTGLVVAIQNERSQLQNREKAMAVLVSRLTALMEQQHQDRLSDLRASDKSAEWGSQIRSYVLHPYTMVKDHRNGAETSQAAKVLDGDIDLFIEAYLDSTIGKSDIDS